MNRIVNHTLIIHTDINHASQIKPERKILHSPWLALRDRTISKNWCTGLLIKLLAELFGHCKFATDNQDEIKVPKFCKPTNEWKYLHNFQGLYSLHPYNGSALW